MIALEKGHLYIARFLIGSEKGKQDENGETALIKAVRCGHVETVRLLASCEKRMENKDGETGLTIANGCYFKRQPIIAIFSQYPEEKP